MAVKGLQFFSAQIVPIQAPASVPLPPADNYSVFYNSEVSGNPLSRMDSDGNIAPVSFRTWDIEVETYAALVAGYPYSDNQGKMAYVRTTTGLLPPRKKGFWLALPSGWEYRGIGLDDGNIGANPVDETGLATGSVPIFDSTTNTWKVDRGVNPNGVVATYDLLPTASEHSGETWLVNQPKTINETLYPADLYDCNGSAWIRRVVDISAKADKVSSATAGNFAGLNASGNLTDSGVKPADFVDKVDGVLPIEQNTLAAMGVLASQGEFDTVKNGSFGDVGGIWLINGAFNPTTFTGQVWIKTATEFKMLFSSSTGPGAFITRVSPPEKGLYRRNPSTSVWELVSGSGGGGTELATVLGEAVAIGDTVRIASDSKLYKVLAAGSFVKGAAKTDFEYSASNYSASISRYTDTNYLLNWGTPAGIQLQVLIVGETITAQAAVTVASSGYVGDAFVNPDTGYGAVHYFDNYNQKVRIFKIETNLTITLYTEVVLGAIGAGGQWSFALTSNPRKFLCSRIGNGTDPSAVFVLDFSSNYNAPTLGTLYNTPLQPAYPYNRSCLLRAVGGDKYICFYNGTTNYMYSVMVTLTIANNSVAYTGNSPVKDWRPFNPNLFGVMDVAEGVATAVYATSDSDTYKNIWLLAAQINLTTGVHTWGEVAAFAATAVPDSIYPVALQKMVAGKFCYFWQLWAPKSVQASEFVVSGLTITKASDTITLYGSGYGYSFYDPASAAFPNGAMVLLNTTAGAWTVVKVSEVAPNHQGDFVGIAQEAGTVGQTKKWVGIGQIASGLSGLTPGTEYYVGYDGSLTAVSNSYPAGRALTATQMLVGG